MKKSILAVLAHADDMEIDMGGSCLKYLDLGYDFKIVYTTNNMAGEFAWADENGKIRSRYPLPEEEMKIRKAEASRAAEIFKTVPIHLDYAQRHYFDEAGNKYNMNYGAAALPMMKPGYPSIITAHEEPAEIQKLAEIILNYDPEVIITRGMADVNIEHVCTALLTMKARQAAMKKGYDGTLLMCRGTGVDIPEAYSYYDTFINTSGLMSRKLDAIGCHASQKPRPETQDYRDLLEGARCGVETVEPFILGGIGSWKVGPMTTEIFKNHLYCKDNFHRMFF